MAGFFKCIIVLLDIGGVVCCIACVHEWLRRGQGVPARQYPGQSDALVDRLAVKEQNTS